MNAYRYSRFDLDVDNSFQYKKGKKKPIIVPYRRLLDRSGRFQLKKEGLSAFKVWSADFYHYICNLSWIRLLLTSIFYFIVLNAIFASLYFIDLKNIGNTSNSSTWMDAFFFSVQTMGTIGYGYYYPKGLYLNLIVTLQCWFCLIMNAIFAGLVITKIQRPTRLRYTMEFSSVAVINNQIPSFAVDNVDWCPTGEYNTGTYVFAFRIFNLRKRLLCMPDLRLLLLHKSQNEYLITEMDFDINRQLGRPRGDSMSKPHLQLPWTVVHRIDALSPLYRKTQQEMIDEEFEIICVLDGVDELTSLNFQSRWSFLPNEIKWHHTFVPMLNRGDDGGLCADYTNLSKTLPITNITKVEDDPYYDMI